MKCELWTVQSFWGSFSAELVFILISLAIFRLFPWFTRLAIFLAVFLSEIRILLFQKDIVAALIYFLSYFFDFSSDWWKDFSFFPCLKFLLQINKVTWEANGHILYFWIIPYGYHLLDYRWMTFIFFVILFFFLDMFY